MKKNYSAEIKRFGKNVKKLRESKGLTQQALSDLCEVDIRTIPRIEKGQYATRLDLLLALLDALGLKAGDLL